MARIVVPEADALLDKELPVLDHGFVRPMYMLAIADALSNGYRVEPVTGTIYGLKGRPLSVRLRGNQRYPFVPLVTPNMPKRFYSVPAHKVIAYAVWGETAFKPGVHVRHLNGNRSDCTLLNLALGTASENERDKAVNVRRHAAQIARAAQGPAAPNRKLTPELVVELKLCYQVLRGDAKKVPNGVMAALVQEFGITKSAIHGILKGETYAD